MFWGLFHPTSSLSRKQIMVNPRRLPVLRKARRLSPLLLQVEGQVSLLLKKSLAPTGILVTNPSWVFGACKRKGLVLSAMQHSM